MDRLTISSPQDVSALSSSSLHLSSKLPVIEYKDRIIKLVKNNQIVIIQGQTGCGKTTQIPQILLKAGLNEQLMIGITQPRKIAAISMAKRVAKEMESALGIEVGYEVRFDKKYGSSTKIKYMTEGILLNECITSQRLSDYGIIIIDEAHERSVNADVLLGLLKSIAKNRNNLKIIITSATISVEQFSKYFNDASMLTIEGRLYPIEVTYDGYHSDYIKRAAKIVQMIHGGDDIGDILVFLTGEEEIEKCCYLLEEIEYLIVKPLYGALDFDMQQDIFVPVKPGERKVVIATNIAETSITIEGIRFVLDCGYVKQSNFITSQGIDILESVRISKAQAGQRKGRAGRTAPGQCHRLYTEDMYETLEDEVIPEIYRKNLSDIYLKLIGLGVKPKEFEFISQPSDEELNRSEQELLDLSLIETNGDLTDIGKSVVEFPVAPSLGKVILTSQYNGCSMEIIKIMSMLSEKNIFNRPKKLRNEADAKHKQFFDIDGDQFTLLNVYDKWLENYPSKMDKYKNGQNTINVKKYKSKQENKNSRNWCRTNFINMNSMLTVDKVFNQINHMLKKNNTNNCVSGDRQSIKKSIISGYFKNICVHHGRSGYMRLYGKESFFIHPQSSLFESRPKMFV